MVSNLEVHLWTQEVLQEIRFLTHGRSTKMCQRSGTSKLCKRAVARMTKSCSQHDHCHAGSHALPWTFHALSVKFAAALAGAIFGDTGMLDHLFRTISQTMQGWCPAVGKMQSSSAIPGQLGFRKLSQVFERQAGDLFPSDGYFKQWRDIYTNNVNVSMWKHGETTTQTGPRSATTLLVSLRTVYRQFPSFDLWVLFPETSTPAHLGTTCIQSVSNYLWNFTQSVELYDNVWS